MRRFLFVSLFALQIVFAYGNVSLPETFKYNGVHTRSTHVQLRPWSTFDEEVITCLLHTKLCYPGMESFTHNSGDSRFGIPLFWRPVGLRLSLHQRCYGRGYGRRLSYFYKFCVFAMLGLHVLQPCLNPMMKVSTSRRCRRGPFEGGGGTPLPSAVASAMEG